MPAARASLPSVFGLVLLLALVPVLAPGNITLLNLGFLTFLYVAQGVAWNILGGFAGYVSFGYAAFYGLGAYTTALLWLAGWPPLLTYPAAGLVAAAFSLIVGGPTLRLTGPYFSIATIGVRTALFKNLAHTLSAFIVGACGGLYATYLQFVHPDTVFSFTQSISLVLITLIGGIGTLWGPVLGAAVFYAVQDYLQTSYPT